MAHDKCLVILLLVKASFLLFVSAKGQSTTRYGINTGTAGVGNSHFGWRTGETITGNYNSNFGLGAGQGPVGSSSNNASYNSNFGYLAGQGNRTDGDKGRYNSTFGSESGRSNLGISNAFFGYNAGLGATGSENSSFGYQSGSAKMDGLSILGGNGNNNSSFGTNAGYSLTAGSYNSSFGYKAGQNIENGQYNANFGSEAGSRITSGNYNSNFGVGAGYSITTGSENTNIGNYAGERISDGSFNITFGHSSGRSLTSGSRNVLLGGDAGMGFLTTSNGNTIVGNQALMNAGNQGAGYHVAIGYAAGKGFGLPPNKSVFILNNQSYPHSPLLFGYFAPNTNPDVATSAPSGTAQLAVNTTRPKDGMVLTVHGPTYIGTEGSQNNIIVNSAHRAEYKLWVEKGIVSEDFALAKVTDWSDYVFKANYSLMPLAEVARYIQTYQHLPNIPSEAELKEKGYSVHQMNKKMMEKIEELTLYAIEQEKKVLQQQQLLSQQQQQISQLTKLYDQYKQLSNKLTSRKQEMQR